MPLSADQKRKLKAQGFSARDIRGISESMNEEPPEDEEPPEPKSKGKPKSRTNRVVVLEGDDAKGFIDRMLGGGGDDDDDDDDEEQDDDDDDDDEDEEQEQDEEPPPIPRFFRERK